MYTRRIVSTAVVAAAVGALGTPVSASAGTIRPATSITVEGCTKTSPANWVRLQLTNGGWECIGYDGTTPYEAFDADAFFAGNNYGTITFNWDYNNYTLCFGEAGNWPSGTNFDNCYNKITYPTFNFINAKPIGNYAIINYVTIKGWGSQSDNP